MILMKYPTLFFSKIEKDVTEFVVCFSHDWRFKGLYVCVDALRPSQQFFSHV